MKIEGQRPDQVTRSDAAQEAQQADRVQAGRQERGRSADAAGDRVEVSSDARLVNAALQQASKAPDIRPDVVERARQKLAAGEVGNDPLRLADRMIDSLLGN